MMFVYYGYLLPLSTRITRGLYADGVWTDSGFMPYAEIGGISWREGEPATLRRGLAAAAIGADR